MGSPVASYPDQVRFGSSSRWAGRRRLQVFGVILPAVVLMLTVVLAIVTTHRVSLLLVGVVLLAIAGTISAIDLRTRPACWVLLDPSGVHDHTVPGHPRDITWDRVLAVAPDPTAPTGALVLTVSDPQGALERQLGVTRVDGSPNRVGMFTDPRVTVSMSLQSVPADAATVAMAISRYRDEWARAQGNDSVVPPG